MLPLEEVTTVTTFNCKLTSLLTDRVSTQETFPTVIAVCIGLKAPTDLQPL